MLYDFVIANRSHAYENQDDAHDDHQLNEREPEIASSAAKLAPRDEGLEIRRVAFVSYFHGVCLVVRGVFVTIDGVTDFVEIVAKNRFLLANHGVPGDRQSGGRQNQQDGTGQDQFKKSQARLRVVSLPAGTLSNWGNRQHLFSA